MPRDFRGSRQANSSRQFNTFHGKTYAQFSHNDHQRWRHGKWHHGHHHGHFGWWFIVDGFWFIYDRPFYPYPTYVSYYYDGGYGGSYGESDYWYWCEDPQGYYPYVQECYGEWIPVPAGGYGSGDGYDGYGPGSY